MKSNHIPTTNCGYIIQDHEIYSRTKEPDGITYEYGIAIAESAKYTGYVTWEFTAVIAENGALLSRSFFWGHYTHKKERALLDYHERLISYYKPSIVDYIGD